MKIGWLRKVSVAMAVLAIALVAPTAPAKTDHSTQQTDPLGAPSGDPLLNHADMGWRQPVIPLGLQDSGPGGLRNSHSGRHHGGVTASGGAIGQGDCLTNGVPMPATAPRHGRARHQPATPPLPVTSSCPGQPSGSGVPSGTDTSGGVVGNPDPANNIIGSNGPLVTTPSHHVRPGPSTVPEPGTLVLLALGLSLLALLRRRGEKR
jgi:hypothetical protein